MWGYIQKPLRGDKMKHLKLTLFLFIIFSGKAFSEVRIIATVDKKLISIHEGVQLEIRVEGTQQATPPLLKNIKGFRMVQGPVESTQMSIVNGRQTSSISYSYILVPLGTGRQTIGPIDITAAGKNYRTKPITIEVVGNNYKAANGKKVANPNILLLLETQKNKAYINEQILVTLTLYFRNIDITGVDPPDFAFDGFVPYDIGGRPVQERKSYNDLIYNTVQFRKILVPIKTGKLSLGPVPLNITISEADNRRRDDLFGSFFGHYRQINKVVQSQPLSIDVLPVPEAGKPASFDGAVGVFSLDAKISPKTVVEGEPVTLSVTLSGYGNLDNMSIALPTNTADFRTYEPETTKRTGISNGKLGGTKNYKQVWVPISEKATSIPAVQFSYFDVNSGKYKEITRGPFPLKVTKDSGAPKLYVTEKAAIEKKGGHIKILRQDIFPNIIKISKAGASQRAYNQPLFFLLIIFPPATWVVLFGIAKRQRRLKTDTAFFRRLNAKKLVNVRLKKARAAFKQNNGQLFYAELSDALCHFIADKLHIAAPQISSASVKGHLENAGINKEIIEDISRTLEEYDFERFSNSSFSGDKAKKQLKHCERLLQNLDKSLK